MHAYLIVGQDTTQKVTMILQKLNGKGFEFPVGKIEEVRQLSTFLRNTQAENTIIIAKNVDTATTEALNAFLKNLEEPQKNVSFILTAKNEYKVLPTIVSRCQVIRVRSEISDVGSTETARFIDATLGERFNIIDKIKQRPEAIEFVQNLIAKLHVKVQKGSLGYLQIAHQVRLTQDCLNALNANGNVGLQLTNLVVNLNSPTGNSS